MSDSEVDRLRQVVNNTQRNLDNVENRVIVLEQQVKDQGEQMDDWVKSGIEHRTAVNMELKSIRGFMEDQKELPVQIAKISTKLEDAFPDKESFWTSPNLRWVTATMMLAFLLIAGVNNADKIKEVIEILFR